MRLVRSAAMAAVLPTLTLMPLLTSSSAGAAQEATPAATYSCETAAAASPMAGHAGMAMSTPAAEDEHDMAGMSVELDQMYIDMMVPHHQSIIALAQAAQDRLTDERLHDIAANIVDSQQAEIEELRGYREAWYGSPEPMAMEGGMMDMMAEMMPGMADMDTMTLLMDADALVARFCAAEDPDLAFIELAIPHHEMAIAASETTLEQAIHDELREVAESVIAEQQREIDELSAILTGEATPAT